VLSKRTPRRICNLPIEEFFVGFTYIVTVEGIHLN